MPMSEYMRDLRARIGFSVLEVPTVSVLTFDDRQRVLLVRHVEGNDWTKGSVNLPISHRQNGTAAAVL